MGRVEVLEHSRASGATTPSISWNTLCFRAGSSKTASMTASQPARSCGSAVAWIRASSSSRFSGVVRPLATALSRSPAEYALPRSAASALTSFRTTSMPAFAHE